MITGIHINRTATREWLIAELERVAEARKKAVLDAARLQALLGRIRAAMVIAGQNHPGVINWVSIIEEIDALTDQQTRGDDEKA